MATNIYQAFNEFKSRLELSETLQNAVSTHHNAIRDWIESSRSDIETSLIGSLQRKTRIQPRSNDTFDIDILVVLGSFTSWASYGQGITPSDALHELDKIMRGHEGYEKMDLYKDFPTVTFNYADGTKAELVPVYRDYIGDIPPKGRGYWIPKNQSNWALADYDYDADYISQKNKETAGWLVPTMKMLKAAKRNLFSEMKSYHLEVLAVNCIPSLVSYYKRQGYQISYPSLIYSFFAVSKDKVLESCFISGSKSPDASAYMNAFYKQAFAEKFKQLENYCQSIVRIDGQTAVSGWRKLFGEPFPAYG